MTLLHRRVGIGRFNPMNKRFAWVALILVGCATHEQPTPFHTTIHFQRTGEDMAAMQQLTGTAGQRNSLQGVGGPALIPASEAIVVPQNQPTTSGSTAASTGAAARTSGTIGTGAASVPSGASGSVPGGTAGSGAASSSIGSSSAVTTGGSLPSAVTGVTGSGTTTTTISTSPTSSSTGITTGAGSTGLGTGTGVGTVGQSSVGSFLSTNRSSLLTGPTNSPGRPSSSLTNSLVPSVP